MLTTGSNILCHHLLQSLLLTLEMYSSTYQTPSALSLCKGSNALVFQIPCDVSRVSSSLSMAGGFWRNWGGWNWCLQSWKLSNMYSHAVHHKQYASIWDLHWLLIMTAVLQEKHQDSVVNTAAIGQNGDIF